MIQIKVKFFAAWREITGKNELEWSLNEAQTAQNLLDQLILEFPELARASSSSLLMINRRYSSREAILRQGDEVAFIPPVGGGAA